MKIVIPKSITIGSTRLLVKQDKSTGSSYWNWNDSVLVLGTKHKDKEPAVFFTALCHEIWELWADTLYLRYIRPDTSNNYEFHFDHRGFANLSEMASKTLLQFIK